MKIKLAITIVAAAILASCSSREKEYVRFGGFAQGTTYSISYRDPKKRNLQAQVDSLLNDFGHIVTGKQS